MTLPCDQPNSILMFPDATEKNEKAIIIFLQPQILPSVKGVGSLAEELCARLCSRFSNYMSHLQKCQPFRGKSKMELLGSFPPQSPYPLYQSLAEPPMHHALRTFRRGECPTAEASCLGAFHPSQIPGGPWPWSAKHLPELKRTDLPAGFSTVERAAILNFWQEGPPF